MSMCFVCVGVRRKSSGLRITLIQRGILWINLFSSYFLTKYFGNYLMKNCNSNFPNIFYYVCTIQRSLKFIWTYEQRIRVWFSLLLVRKLLSFLKSSEAFYAISYVPKAPQVEVGIRQLSGWKVWVHAAFSIGKHTAKDIFPSVSVSLFLQKSLV